MLARLILFLKGRKVFEDPDLRGLSYIFVVLAVCFCLNTLSFYYFERTGGKDVGLFDSVWYNATTITTVGYGDQSPATIPGRVTTMILMYGVGVACLPLAISNIVSYLVKQKEMVRTGMKDFKGQGGIVIVNFPGEHWIQVLMRELKGEPSLAELPVCIIDPILERLPPGERLENVSFVRGNTIEIDTYKRANLAGARYVLVLPRSPELADSDAATHTIISILRKQTQARIIPLCVDGQNTHLFEGYRALVTLDLAIKAAVQEMSDPLFARALDNLVRNTEGCMPYSMAVKKLAGTPVVDVEAALVSLRKKIDEPVGFKLLAHVREGEPEWLPQSGENLQEGDVLLVTGRSRPESIDQFEDCILQELSG